MPMDRSRYPADWNEIAKAVKDKAGWCCEECGLVHGMWIIRNSLRPNEYQWQDDDLYWHDVDGEKIHPDYCWQSPAIKVVITVHHVGVDKPDGTLGDPDDKMDNRSENLKALCQRCHLLADLESHRRAAKKTRQRKAQERRAAAGQKEMW